MRIGLIWERKDDFPFREGDRADVNSELLSEAEEDAILSGLRDAGHEVVRIGDGVKLISRPPGTWREICDLVFNLSVGYRGLDRKSWVPGVLELARIPYVGSESFPLTLTRHKHDAKAVVAAAGVATSPGVLWIDDASTVELDRLDYPCIVKPVAESSSIGIGEGSVVHSAAEAAARARWAVDTFNQAGLVEEFIRGTEVEVPLLGWPKLEPLGVVAITIDGTIVAGDSHLVSDSVYSDHYGFVSPMPGLDTERICEAARRAARALHMRDYGRIDFRVKEDGTPVFMEASTHPHIQQHSSFYHLASKRGLSHAQMLDEIISVARKRLGL